MNQFIPQDVIINILNQVNIIDIISERIKIKKIGKNYYALCPFHSENTPSFTINIEKQYFYCFGCNIHGNIIDFLMKYDQLTFLESMQELSNITGIKIFQKNYNVKNQKKHYKKQKLEKAIQIAGQLYYNNIYHKNSKIAQLYLKKRKINNHTIDIFNIGYSNDLLFLSKNIKNKKYISYLKNIGIIYTNQNYQYDRFYNKIIFPIKNQYGKITGFGGRTLNNTHPKYINSSQTDIFKKGYQLYGIDKIHIQDDNKYIIIVEGYFDVLSLFQFNIKNVVAILGTIITNYQINILFKLTNHLIFCYDGDQAGKKAAWRTTQIILPYINDIKNIQFIFLPKGEDPNSIIYKEGKEKFNNRIKNAINIIDFFLKKITKKINLNSIYEISKMLNFAIPIINNIPNQYIKIYLKKMLGQKIGIIDDIKLDEIIYQKKKYINSNIIKSNNIHILISLIIQNPILSTILPFKIYELKKINIPGISLFLEIFKICKKNNNINTGQIIELYRNQKNFFIIQKLAYWNNLIHNKKKNKVFIDLIKKIYNIALEKKYNLLIMKDRLKKLQLKEKYLLWKINKVLSI
ncbi:DNA primase [Buchnera aphidicola]|uniref:DNA primase n=1 Tax=Buchnera aphidicola (Therioaphis trifolii) TaxID=1241884 RepID=A0A4D6YK56_9GAMM|nr:DNA primase [Buchnera aphidicola]QCI27051.1 DNA primase [Buchnera aphidicola (Therioaphis trifolii)]